ncbi:MAG TPA: hypothetical protein VNC18_17580 [Gemmatimonadaceae bacterium]|jgi:hypothetical protein|nr:hypothetical protein [Gemmatimonadaceae bacterium]
MSSPFFPPSIPGQAGYPLTPTGASAATRYVGATASGAPATGSFLVGDFIIDQTGKVYVCTVAGSPGTWVQAGASSGGGFGSYAQVSFGQPQNTDGGQTTSGSDQVYPINAEDFDTGSILTVAANTMTVEAGSYYVDGWGTVTQQNARARVKLRDTSNSVDLLLGRSLYQQNLAVEINNNLTVRGRIVLAAQTNVQLHYVVQSSENTSEGLGVATNYYGAEKYAEVTFWKEL